MEEAHLCVAWIAVRLGFLCHVWCADSLHVGLAADWGHVRRRHALQNGRSPQLLCIVQPALSRVLPACRDPWSDTETAKGTQSGHFSVYNFRRKVLMVYNFDACKKHYWPQ